MARVETAFEFTEASMSATTLDVTGNVYALKVGIGSVVLSWVVLRQRTLQPDPSCFHSAYSEP